jgi:hypothetical protein
MTDRLNPQTSQKIASAVESAFQAATEGVDPSLAVAKAATEASLNVDQTKRACEALNVTRTLSFNKTASKDDKCSAHPFDIADPDKVISIMYPDGVPEREKTPDYEKEAFYNDSAYDLDDFGKSAFESIYSCGDLDDPTADLTPVTFDSVYKKIASRIDAGRTVLDRVTTEYDNLLVGIERNLNKIASQVETIYGSSVADIDDEVLRGAVSSMITKTASERPATGATNRELDLLVDDTNKMMQRVSGWEKLAAAVSDAVEDMVKIADTPKLQTLVERGPEAFRPIMGRAATDRTINSRLIEPLISTNYQNISDNLAYNPYTDPAFIDVLNSRQALKSAVGLTRLMRDDPVLNRAGPERVISAYNSIFSDMPGLFNNPEMARSALRQHIEYGSIDHPTMAQLKKIEEGLKPDLDLEAKQKSRGEKNTKLMDTFTSRRDMEKDRKQREIEKKYDRKDRKRELGSARAYQALQQAEERKYREDQQAQQKAEERKYREDQQAEERKYREDQQAEERKYREDQKAKEEKDKRRKSRLAGTKQ